MKRPAFFPSSLESKAFFIFTLLVFLTILLMQIVAYSFTRQSIIDTTNTNKGRSAGQLVHQLDSYIKAMKNIVHAVAEDRNVQQYLASPEGFITDRELSSFLAAFLRARDDITTIALFRKDGKTVTSRNETQVTPYCGYRGQAWYVQAVENPEKIVISSVHVQNLFFENYPWVVSLSTVIPDHETRTPAAVLLVDLNFNQIRELCHIHTLELTDYIFILDSSGNYVYHPQQQLVYSGIKSEPIEELLAQSTGDRLLQHGTHHYITRSSAKTGWNIVWVSERKANVARWRNVQTSYALIGLAAFIIVGLVANFLAQTINKPVRELCAVMQSVEMGNFDIEARIDSTDEIQQLAHEFNIMLRKIRDLIAQINREQSLKRKSELKALQAQINPHFLYNTLDSIIWMAEMKRNREVVKMTEALARLFRLSISKGREFITIEDEIEHVKNYLTIQKMRYRDQFEYEIEVDPDILAFPCLKIILQPLVENAIYHGIKGVDYEGLIRITGKRVGEDIILNIIDNGKGIDPGTVRGILSSDPKDNKKLSRGGVGMRNVHERLRLYFGQEYGLRFDNGVEGSSIVSIVMPVKQEAPG